MVRPGRLDSPAAGTSSTGEPPQTAAPSDWPSFWARQPPLKLGSETQRGRTGRLPSGGGRAGRLVLMVASVGRPTTRQRLSLRNLSRPGLFLRQLLPGLGRRHEGQ